MGSPIVGTNFAPKPGRSRNLDRPRPQFFRFSGMPVDFVASYGYNDYAYQDGNRSNHLFVGFHPLNCYASGATSAQRYLLPQKDAPVLSLSNFYGAGPANVHIES